MAHANHLSAAELHAAMGTTEMPPLGGGVGGGVAPPDTPGVGVAVAPPATTSMATQMMTQPPHSMVTNAPTSSILPSSFTGGSFPANVRRVSPPHHVPVGGVPLHQFASIYPPTSTQQFPPRYSHQRQPNAAMAPAAQLSPEALVQIRHRQQATSQRFLSGNASHVFSQAETMHLTAVKRVQIDKMRKEIGGSSTPVAAVGGVGGWRTGSLSSVPPGAFSSTAAMPKNEELEAAASMAAVESLSSAATEPKE